MNVRRTLFLALTAGAVSVSSPLLAATAPPPILVELFTSQGCSDCPPADHLLRELAARKDVVALTLPITYWDMLGWKDTLATDANTQRQKAYAKAMSRSGVYTPQIVVGGAEHVIGGHRDKVLTAIAHAQAQREFVPIAIAQGSGRVTVTIAARAEGQRSTAATIWLMHTLSHAKVAIGGGENNTRELVYANVVREMQRFGDWDGGEKNFTIPMRAEPGKQDGIAIVLQRADYGPVIGAALVALR